MRPKDPLLRAQLEEIGAIHIPNFLSPSSFNKIRALYNELNLEDLGEIYSNVKDQSPEFNYKVDRVFKEIFKPSIEKHFTDYEIGGGAFLIKGTGHKSESSLHQDWNIVDESKYASAAIFCPLIDVNEFNGCLKVISGSHKWFNNIRSFQYPSPYLSFDEVGDGIVSFPAKAGDAVVFRHNVIHGSNNNISKENRIAASMSITSKDAQRIHFILQNDSFATIKAEENFFCNVVPSLYEGKQVDFEFLNKTPYTLDHVSTHEDFLKKYGSVYGKKKKGFWNRIFKT